MVSAIPLRKPVKRYNMKTSLIKKLKKRDRGVNLQKFQDRNVYRNVMDSKDYYCVLIEDCREK